MDHGTISLKGLHQGKAETVQPRLKPYPAYKDSGVEWLGEIPAHWDPIKLKRVCTFAYGDALASGARTDGDVEVYGSNGPVGWHEHANTLAPSLVIGRKGSFGKVNFSMSAVFAIDTTFFVDRRYTQADIRWLYYVLTNARLDSATKDSAIPGLDREDAYSRDVCLCPPHEQGTIAAFLDRETARIDALVAKKERLIELLQEKRTALITQAVTKGLDPNAPMKDSGVDWLGEIPAHWEVRKLKFCMTHIVDCLHSTPEYLDNGEYPAVRTEDISPGRLDLVGSRKLNREQYVERTKRLQPEAGDIVYSREGERFGFAALVPQGVELCLAQRVMHFRTGREADSPFLMWALNSDSTYRQASLDASGATSPHVNVETIRNFVLACPSHAEQEGIGRWIGETTSHLDELETKVREGIGRLMELRTALISEAVTGKIDVRGEAA